MNASEMILTLEYIRNDFYYRNALEIIFIIEIHWKRFLL